MSSPIVIPFNFDPIETSIKTANYTIPAGRYAYAMPGPSLDQSAHQFVVNSSLTINSNHVLINSNIFYRFPSSAMYRVTSTASRTITAPAFGRFDLQRTEGTVEFNVSNVDGIVNTQSFAGAVSTQYFILARTFNLALVSSAAAGLRIIWTPSHNPLTGFWLKSGDIINGSGVWSVLLTEYNKII